MFCKYISQHVPQIFSDAKEYADEINAIFTETSALTAVNIKELFEQIGKLLKPNPAEPGYTLT